MKIKVVQKMLAVMVAIATVATTPGLASAMLGKKTCRPKNQDDENLDHPTKLKKQNDPYLEPLEVQNLVEQLCDILEKKSQISGNDISKIMEKLTQKENLYGQEKKIFETFFSILNNNLIQNFNARCVMKLFAKHVDKPDVKNIVLDCFCRISSEFQFNQMDFENILKILTGCCDNDYTRKSGAYIINNLASNGFFIGCQKDQVSKIVDIMIDCSSENSAKKDIMCAVSKLVVDDFFKDCQQEQMQKMLDVIFSCSNQDEVRKNVAVSIAHLAQGGIFKKYPKEKIPKLIDVIVACSKDQNARLTILDVVEKLFQQGTFSDCPKEQFSKINDMLNDLSKNNDIKDKVELVLQNLAKHSPPKNLAKKNMPPTTNISNTGSDNVNDNENILDSVLTLNDENLLRNYSKEETAPIIKILLDNARDDKFTQKRGSSVVKLIYNWISKDWSKNDLKIMLIIFNEYSKNNEVKKHFLDFIRDLLKKDSVNDFSNEQMQLVFDMLSKCSHNDDLKKSTAQVVMMLTSSKNFFKNFFSKEKKRIICILNRCVKINNSKEISGFIDNFFPNHAQKNQNEDINMNLLDQCFEFDNKETKHLSSVAIHNILLNYDLQDESEEKIALILETLGDCVNSKEAQNDVLNSILDGVLRDAFKNSREELTKILNILEKCCDNNEAKDKIAQIISVLVKKRVFRDQVTNILNILTKCCDCDAAKKFTMKATLKLLNQDFLINCKEEEINKTSYILNNLVGDDDLKENTLQMISFLFSYAFKNLSKEQACQLLDILRKCGSDDVMKIKVAETVRYFICAIHDLKNIGREGFTKILDILNEYCYDYHNKDGLVKSIDMLTISRNVDSGCSKEEFMLIMSIFKKNFKYDNVKLLFARPILDMILKGCFKNCSKDEAEMLLDLLKECCNSDKTKPFFQIAENILRDGDFSATDSEKNKTFIINEINKYTSDLNQHEFVYEFISCLGTTGYLKNYSEQELTYILNILSKFIDNDSYVKKSATKIVYYLIECYHLNKYPKEKFKLILDILYKCSDDKIAKDHIPTDVYNVFLSYASLGCLDEEAGPWLCILEKLSEDVNQKKHVAELLFNLTSEKLFKNFSKKNMLKIMDILDKCVDNDDAKIYILQVVFYMIHKKYFNGDSENMLREINLIGKCAVDYADLKTRVLEKISGLVHYYYFYKCSEAESVALMNILDQLSGDPESTLLAVKVLSQLVSTYSLKNYPKENAEKIINILSKLANNIKLNEDKWKNSQYARLFSVAIIYFFRNGFLNDLPMNKIEYLLNESCKSDSDKKYVNVARYFVTNGTKTTAHDLLEILNKFIQEGNQTSEASGIIAYVAAFGGFKNCSDEEIKSLLEILDYCSNDISLQSSILLSIKNLTDNGCLDNYLKYEKKLLIEIIYKCFNNDEAKYNLFLVIDSLNQKNFFKNDLLKIVKFLDTCADVDKLKPNTSKLVNRLIYSQTLKNYPKNSIIDILYRCADCNCDQDKSYILSCVLGLSSEKISNPLSNFEISKLFKVLERCIEGQFNDVALKKMTSETIQSLTSSQNWLKGGASKDDILRVMKILSFCINNKNINNSINSDIFQIASSLRNLISSQTKGAFSSEEVEQIMELLAECCHAKADVGKYTEDALLMLISGEFGKENLKTINILLEHDVDNKFKNNLLTVIYDLVRNGFVKNWPKDQKSDILKILPLCNKNDNARSCIGYIAVFMVLNDFLQNCSKDEALQVSQLLRTCSDSNLVKSFVKANIKTIIFKLINDDFMKDCSEEEIFIIMDSLAKGKIEKDVLEIFDILSSSNYLKYRIKKTISILEKWDKNKQNHEHIINIIQKLIDNECLNNSCKDEIKKITDILIGHIENDQLKLASLMCIQKLLISKSLNDLPKDKTNKIINALNYLTSDNQFQYITPSILTSLASNGILDGYSQDEVLPILNILYGCCRNRYAKIYVATAFFALTKRDCFSGFFADEIKKMVKLLDKFADDDDAKHFVSNILLNLATHGHLKKITKDEISKIIDVLDTCANKSNAKSHVALTITQLIINDVCREYLKDEISKIVNIIGQCCGEESSQKFAADAIDQLVGHGVIEKEYANMLKNWWSV